MPPRYVPELPLPPYAHVPGRTPHPIRDPAGHSHGLHHTPPPLDPARWRDSRDYLRGLDLFNHGYYWEAHEQWEALWHAAGRRGPVADLLKGLIRLAACGVKAREGRPAGVASHAAGAARLFRAVGAAELLGLSPAELLRFTEIAAGCRADTDQLIVFPFTLAPRAEAAP